MHDLSGKNLRSEYKDVSESKSSFVEEQVTTELAGALFLERTPEMFAKIEDALKLTEKVATEISGHNRPEAITLLSSISVYLRQLRDRRAEEKEVHFLSEVSMIKRKMDRYERNFQLFRLLAVVAAGLIGWLGVVALGAATPILFVSVFLFALALSALFYQAKAWFLPKPSSPSNRLSLIEATMNLMPAWIAWGVIGMFFPAYPAPLAGLAAALAVWAPLFGAFYSPLEIRLREELLGFFKNRYSVKEERLF